MNSHVKEILSQASVCVYFTKVDSWLAMCIYYALTGNVISPQ
jgi:hypothetical protein